MFHFLTDFKKLMSKFLNVIFNNVKFEWLTLVFYYVRGKAPLG